MRRLFHCLGCLLPLSIAGPAGAAVDPPHKHYAVSRIPADPALEKAPKMGRYRGFLRPKVDLAARMPPIGDQGNLGSGIAWAIAYAARSYYAGRNEDRDIESPDNEASPGYVFQMAREGDCADGANITDTVAVLQKGALSLAAYPYKSDCEARPAASIVQTARDFRVKGYRVVDNSRVDDVKAQLYRSNPVITFFRVSQAFSDFRGSGTFKENESSNAPSSSEDVYQPLVIIGYDDTKQAVRVMNSWGRGWGDKGFAWISYEDLAARSKGSVVLDVAPAEIAKNDHVELSDPPPQPVELPPSLIDKPVPKAEAPQEQPQEKPQEKPQQKAEEKPQEKPQQKAQKEEPKKEQVKNEPVEPPKPKIKLAMADLRSLPCSRIDRVRTKGHVTLEGFIDSQEDYERLQDLAASKKDVSIGKVTVAPWPLCEALDTLDKPLKASLRPVLTTSAHGLVRAGETLRVNLKSPGKPSYVYLAYFEANRTVVTLAQPQGLTQTRPRMSLVFGDGANNTPKFTVGPPYGNEMVVAIASASPLFNGELPENLSERDFLSMLRKALLYKPSPRMPDREVGAAIQILKTEPK